MNPRERHRPMAMRVQSGTPDVCIAMAPPEQRECVLTPYRANPSLSTPILQVLDLIMETMFKALT